MSEHVDTSDITSFAFLYLQNSLLKWKVRSKYRISAMKRIRLAEFETKAAKSVIFNSNNDITIQSHESDSTDCNDETDSSFERHINFHSENNSAIQNSESIDYTSSEQNDIKQSFNKQSDVDEILNFNNEEEKNNYLLNGLREWSLRGVPKKKVDELLALLIPIFPFLPKSYKTLLHTMRKVTVSDYGDGQFWYKGIKLNIRQLLSDGYIHQYGEIVIDVNIDGIPLSKSSEMHFWPILGKFQDSEHPFLIAVYLGPGKPSDVNVFLEKFVAEVADLQESGFQ